MDNNGGIDQKSIEWFLSKLDRSMVKPNDVITSDGYHKIKTLRRNFDVDEKLNNFDDTSIISEPFLVKDILRDETHPFDMMSNQKYNDEKLAIGPAVSAEEVLIDRLNKRKHQDRKQNWQILRNNVEPSILISEDDVRNYT
ncbi:uncharacterized protein LOC123305959 [Chrysoperla carnea]|uniref:uncharacterized protein LOC123305959 n=1 Tax=Chrysoperla carnea TaxID=189513 RepID=UPI001D091204|nr:uncharacterized protein LOC123305959 [Chrysoperla carnea]